MTAFAAPLSAYHDDVAPAEAVRRFAARATDFAGRSNRGEHWWAVLALALASVLTTALDRVLGLDGLVPLTTLVALVTLLPSLALHVRRLHDIGLPGWLAALPLGLVALSAPAFWATYSFGLAFTLAGAGVVAAVALLLLACRRGDPSANLSG